MTQIPTWSGGPVSSTSTRAAPGTTIGGRYSLRAAVGHGGMGTVWRASDTLLRRDVAVKEVVLPPGLAPSDRDAMYERTLREARAAAALQHPAVVQVYDVVTEGGRPWIVMELLDARSLADMVIEDGPVAQRAVAKIGIALLGALEVAHAIGVLHRDVKPANVLICTDGRCVLTDFGVARMPTEVQLTTPGMVLGSPHFISPERAMGQDFGPPSDLFSLGVTLYTAVEGRPPFDKGDPIETMHAVVEDPPAPPVRSGPLTEVLLGLLEKDPARRFDVPTARSILRELLAGPLASKAPANLVTDPYAVVQPQRPPAWRQQAPAAPAPAPAQPTGKIGGRAMIGPDESLTDRLAELRRAGRQMPSAAQWSAAGLDNANPTSPAAGPVSPAAPHSPTARHSAAPPAHHPAAGPVDPAADRTAPIGQVTPPGRGGTAAVLSPTGAMPAPTWSEGPPGGQPGWSSARADRGAGSGATAGAMLDRAIAGVRQTSARAVTTVKGWDRKVQIGAAAGATLLILLLSTTLFNSGQQEPQQPSLTTPQITEEPPPAIPTKTVNERGVSVAVPEGWEKASGGLYTDFADPDDPGRKVRIVVEPFGSSAQRWAEVAENGLKKPDSQSCARPYAQLDMTTEVELAGREAAQFEYTCGDGDSKRHGVWRAVVAGGKAYSFFLTTPDARFEESKPIFDEMVRTFQLTEVG
ncbi:serine/threonine-protein kinase [Solwaraspora sp. WMMD791]|uniref:serine/threonine-protein kinase n=1 Tax=Solwaraspora sp. WMMD791 TaxID=3016086 RepID=UPI00249ABD5C|nr:serine/threonine-protein kinase [Solwaraspora sp. WMMD791]WFE26727.1 serine/threonine-protein kinase [Solwaraspora sp. WMMD791]